MSPSPPPRNNSFRLHNMKVLCTPKSVILPSVISNFVTPLPIGSSDWHHLFFSAWYGGCTFEKEIEKAAYNLTAFNFFITMVKLHHKSPTVSVVVWRVHCQLVICPSRPSIHHYHNHHLHQTLHELFTSTPTTWLQNPLHMSAVVCVQPSDVKY